MRYLSSAIGRKQVMGVTGLIWSGFVLSHMIGNMLIFVGPEAYNKYAYALTSNPLLLLAEGALLLTLLMHVYDGIMLTVKNKAARPQKYAMATNGAKAARFQSRFMIFHGSLILVFIVLHLITFKYGLHYTASYDGKEIRDLHRLVVEVFQSPTYVAWYAVCMVAVGFHLSHGFYSAFASLGVYHPTYSYWLSKIGYLYGLIIALGFVSQPIYVFFFAH